MSGQVKSFLDRLSQVRTGRVMSGNQYGIGQFGTVQVRPGLVKFGQVKSESGQMNLTLFRLVYYTLRQLIKSKIG